MRHAASGRSGAHDLEATEVEAHRESRAQRLVSSPYTNRSDRASDDVRGTYDGVEIHRDAVEWCQRTITSADPRFRFHRADVVSSAYNPDGLVPSFEYTFPFPDQSFDFIFLASVFTHMLPESVEH